MYVQFASCVQVESTKWIEYNLQIIFNFIKKQIEIDLQNELVSRIYFNLQIELEYSISRY